MNPSPTKGKTPFAKGTRGMHPNTKPSASALDSSGRPRLSAISLFNKTTTNKVLASLSENQNSRNSGRVLAPTASQWNRSFDTSSSSTQISADLSIHRTSHWWPSYIKTLICNQNPEHQYWKLWLTASSLNPRPQAAEPAVELTLSASQTTHLKEVATITCETFRVSLHNDASKATELSVFH